MRWAWAARWRRRRGWALLALLAALAASALPTRCSHALTAQLSAPPRALAHFLADFTNQPKLYPYLEAWTVEDEWSNVTSWRYTVSYSCGERCAGRALVAAHDEPAHVPAAPAPAAPALAPAGYRVHVTHTHCTRLPLLPWPQFCDEMETEVEIRALGAGSQYRERAAGRCAALQVLTGRCAAELRARRDRHLLRLRQLMQHYD